MRLVNTHISNDCTRKCLVYVDANGHYEVQRKQLKGDGWELTTFRVFKHIESANRAVQKWVK